jgi:hypothetical protein
MKYSKLLYCLFFFLFSHVVFSQTEFIDAKSKKIDSLFKVKALEEKIFPQMSRCGGSLKGYYLKNELILIHTLYSGPMGFTDTKWYLENGKLFKSVQFGFELVEPAHVEFRIVDMNEKVLVSLVNQEFSAGTHPILFNSTNYPNGLYYYQFISPLQNISKKFIIDN